MVELEHFLHDELARLETSVRTIARESRTAEKAGLTDDGVPSADALQTEMQVTLMDRRTQQVAQIRAALERLSSGQYGLCQDCEAFMGVARLRALPFAQRCRDCQSRAERRGRTEALSGPDLSRELEVA